MTGKRKKIKGKPRPSRAIRTRALRIDRLLASVEDDLFTMKDGKSGAEARWNRPRKQRISLRVDAEVVDWFKSKGPGYQTRINQILRKVMIEGKSRAGER